MKKAFFSACWLSIFLAITLSLNSVFAEELKKSLHVATTVPPITNIVKNIGGSAIEVTGIVPNGVDSHTFEPVPSDAKILAEADVIIVNGLGLEIPTIKLAEKVKKPGTPIIR